MSGNYKRVKAACYVTNISMSVVGNISPILFLTFRSLYGISYSQMGLLVLANFVTQLTVDLAFSFFSHKINMRRAVKITPALTVIGLLVYAASPFVFSSNVYLGLLLGTVVFSASGGFVEVLISPVIAAIPAPDPDREMSKLHSVYAWGVVGVILVSTGYIALFGSDYWWVLSLVFLFIPLTAFFLFLGADLPALKTETPDCSVSKSFRNRRLWICVLAIFLGGAAECTMAQWSSGYLEQALGIPKIWGDIFGVALFALMLGFGRTLYSKIGKDPYRALLLGGVGATACYIIAVISNVPIIGLLACAFTGFAVSMLWPGSLIVAADYFPSAGVFIYAVMAAGGDLGASVSPQLVGIVADAVAASEGLLPLAESLGITADQLGMKAGMLVGALFSLFAAILYFVLWRTSRASRRKIKEITGQGE